MLEIGVKYLRKTLKVFALDVCQSLYSDVKVCGSFIGMVVLLIQMPLLAYCRHLFVERTKVGMARERGCAMPRPPDVVAIVAMRDACLGRERRLQTCEMILSTIAVNSSAILLSQTCQCLGRLL